jgi:four helix bundle protein
MVLAREIYRLTDGFPASERFGLTPQMRRSAVSVPSNIAEGHGRLSDRYLRNFLGNARGSLFELETQTLLALDLGYAGTEAASNVMTQAAEVGRILNGLLKTLEADERE